MPHATCLSVFAAVEAEGRRRDQLCLSLPRLAKHEDHIDSLFNFIPHDGIGIRFGSRARNAQRGAGARAARPLLRRPTIASRPTVRTFLSSGRARDAALWRGKRLTSARIGMAAYGVGACLDARSVSLDLAPEALARRGVHQLVRLIPPPRELSFVVACCTSARAARAAAELSLYTADRTCAQAAIRTGAALMPPTTRLRCLGGLYLR
jgi:hypothetical protein